MQMAWYKNCAYVGNGSAGEHPLEGTAVIDVKDPSKPELVQILSSPTGRNSWEGLEVAQTRGLLVAFATSRTAAIAAAAATQGAQADSVDIYDLSKDCRIPTRVSTIDLRAVLPDGLHGLKISPDGNTLYISTIFTLVSANSLVAVDISTASSPKVIAQWKWSDDPDQKAGEAFHDGEISSDGKTLYMGTEIARAANRGDALSRVGVIAFDVTAIQNRSANPTFTRRGAVYWTDCSSQGHTLTYAEVAAKPYIFAGAECTGVQWHVIPVSDPTNLSIAATYNIEASSLSNAQTVAADQARYQAHYTGLDSVTNATTMFVTWYSSGLRVLDIRDPLKIKEVAYLNPPAHPNNVFCGFACATNFENLMSEVRYDAATGNVWFAGVNGGFYVAHLTTSAEPSGLAK